QADCTLSEVEQGLCEEPEDGGFQTLAVVLRKTQHPACSLKDLRSCGTDYVPYGKATHMAETEAELGIQCETQLAQVRCTSSFAGRCLEQLPRVVGLLAYHAAEEDIEAICTPGTEMRQQYQDSVQCMNAAGGQLNVCLKTAFESFESIVANVTRKEKINYACCHYHNLLDCLQTAVKDCDHTPALEFLTTVNEHIFGQVLSLVCGVHSRGSDACKKLPPLPPLAPGSADVGNFLEPIIDIANSLRGGK
ncbi:unnamed protein product, partial [Ixodes persulcatus]